VKKSTKWIIGGIAVAAAVGGIIYYEKNKPAAASNALPPGTSPVTSLVPGQKYTFASVIDSTMTSSAVLVQVLQSHGWTNVTVPYFAGSGTLPAGFQGNTGTYVAVGTWSGAAGPIPAGLFAVPTT
jgi:hypothetical protein